jgi:hypothetical protein
LTDSDQSLQRVLGNPLATPAQRAEALALQARNAKARGRALLSGQPERECRLSALQAGMFFEAQDLYTKAFEQDLNHFYSGLNALSLSDLLLGIIELEPDAWESMYDSEKEAAERRDELKASRERLAAVVDLSLQSAERRATEPDIWRSISVADYKFLTGKKDGPVAVAYRQALAKARPFEISAARDQLELFRSVGVRMDRVQTCLESFPAVPARSEPLRHGIVFTGHMIDAPDRAEPRFPPDMEQVAREAIRREVAALIDALPGRALGIAGGANGGDILFHEVCAGLNIPTRVLLALPEGPFIAESVAHGGPDWIARFGALMTSHAEPNEVQVLGPDKTLPGWMREPDDYDIWQRTNLWLLEEAFASAAPNLTLIALWDGQSGDGPGGTKDLVDIARNRGVRTVLLNTTVLFSGASGTAAGT